MGGDNRFWTLFGSIWLLAGGVFVVIGGGGLIVGNAAGGPWLPLLFLLVGALVSAVAVFILYRARVAAARERRLMTAGVDATATVTEIKRSSVAINGQYRWYVSYRYEFAGRSLQGTSVALPADAVAGFKSGDRVPIKIDPQHPEETLFLGVPKVETVDVFALELPAGPSPANERAAAHAAARFSLLPRWWTPVLIGIIFLFAGTTTAVNGVGELIAGEGDLTNSVVAVTLGPAVAALGGGMLLVFLWRKLRERRLLRDGKTAAAIVVAVEPSQLSINRVRQWTVRYRFRDGNGRERVARSGYLSPSAASQWNPGSPCTVRYDPGRPQDSLLVDPD